MFGFISDIPETTSKRLCTLLVILEPTGFRRQGRTLAGSSQEQWRPVSGKLGDSSSSQWMPASAAVISLSPLGDLRINGYDTDIPLLTLFEEPVKGSAARVNDKR